jgi:hypothetical protein
VTVKTGTDRGGCSDAALAELMTPYCFDDATEEQKLAFELHLMDCDVCWAEVQRLQDAVRALRSDMSLAKTLTVREISGLLGMSAALDESFGGHRRHVLLTSTLYALLYALPVFVELAYQWDRYAQIALIVGPLAALWILATTLVALKQTVSAAREARGPERPLVIMFAATAVLCAVLLPLAPNVPTVEASFTTYPVNLGYLKSVFYAWCVEPIFMLWPYHFVLVMQRQLQVGRHRLVEALLLGRPEGLPPPGTRYPRLWILSLYLAGLFIFNWLGVSHLFDHLVMRRYTTLFMTLVLLRAGVWLLLPVVCLWWYQHCLTELKREALAVLSFVDPPEARTPSGDHSAS